MDTITKLSRTPLLALMERATFPAVSIYMPTHVVARGVGEDPIVLKNLLRSCEDQLRSRDVRVDVTDRLLAEARALTTGNTFWKEQRRGLALFIAESGTTCASFEHDVSPAVYVGDQFVFTPLIRILSMDEDFRVLALSRNGARVYEGDAGGLNSVEAVDAIPTFDDYLASFETDRNLQFHTSSVGGPGGRTSTSFGYGSEEDETKRHLVEYFRQIDNRILEHFHDPKIPLVLAGIEYTLPLYRSATRYGFVMDEGITVNPDDLNERELHSRAWEIVQDVVQKKQRSHVDHLNMLAGTGMTTTDLEQMTEAASQGRVEYLFLSDNDPARESGDTLTFQVNGVAMDTIRTGGEVVTVPHGSLYDNASVAAVLRY